MFYCSKCNMTLPDGANVCPYCKAVQNNQNVYSQIRNTPHDTPFESAENNGAERSGLNPYSADEGERFYFQQKLTECINDIEAARGLGIVTIVCAVIASFAIAAWVCGFIGIAKANSAIDFAEKAGDARLLENAKKAKSLNKTGLIISAVMLAVIVGGFILFSVFIGLNTNY